MLGLLILILLASSPVQPALAKKKNTGPDPSAQAGYLPGVDPETASLLWQLSHKPQLLTVDYLGHYFGPPFDQRRTSGMLTYTWYDNFHRPLFELHQRQGVRGQIVQSIFVSHLADNRLNSQHLEKSYGAQAKRFFDQSGQPGQIFATAPATTISFMSPPNSFSVRKATIVYNGVPNLAADDLQTADQAFLAKTTNLPEKTDWRQQEELCRNRLNRQPSDATAHAGLACALGHLGHSHAAVQEYRTAMSLNPSDQILQQRCIAGLKQLKYLPENYMRVPTETNQSLAEKQPENALDGKRLGASVGTSYGTTLKEKGEITVY